ncbi:oxygen-dependent tRNA uridine(34) hydroxylase TrhO [Williamsia deligens]|uniref:tRNA uridine(34) hydroxylase n=1 Tax=Williamsia deligens TaxID=321325 RepID=A0ABW3G1M1_9NOCA|nr:rhodanese-related sulfurtransferase [Williamsia deligens]
MSQSKIVLFYVFVPLPDPEAVRLWQLTLAESLGLRGRVVVASHGINATVGGEIRAVKRYVRRTREYPPFARADVKWSDGGAYDFPRLSVRVRPEIVTFGRPDIVVDQDGVVGGGHRLDPDGLHALVDSRGDDVVFLDGRNEIESRIGRFRGAITPPARVTTDLAAMVDAGEFDHLRERTVVTYCTGGVRCEVLSALLVQRGFTDVHQLDGGIARYGERFGDRGLWEGSMYVFDRRMRTRFSDDAAVIAMCETCGTPTDHVVDLPDDDPRDLAVLCPTCAGQR